MTWDLPKIGHTRFERNPLVAVVVQLRFHPVLKIADRVSDFQERVRALFPVFQEGTSELVSYKPPDLVNVRRERQFSFRKEDGATSIILGIAAIALENRRHSGHKVFLDDVSLAVESLSEVYQSIAPLRLGMRYINIIDRERIGKDLGRDVDWQELISEDFLRMPAGLTDLDNTLFSNEISSQVNGGALTLRYGLLRGQEDEKVHFRFDTDRYFEGSFDVSTIMEKLFSFVADIHSPFATMIGPALREWMHPLEGESNDSREEE